MTNEEGARPGPGTRSTDHSFTDQDTAGTDSFWQSRPVLQRIHDIAQARRAAPWAVLGCAMARVIATIPPFVVLPPLVGGHGSLNIFVGLIGESGSGKGAATAVAADAVFLEGVFQANLGSGEGLSHLFAKRTREGVERLRESVLVTVQEIDTMTALGSRNGSTTLPELRKAWSGETLGFSYSDPAKRLDVQAHTYRLTMIAGIQPGRAGALLDDSDGGTPQRFVWMSATDKHAPDIAPPEPEPWTWKWQDSAPFRAEFSGKVIVDVCREARAHIDAQRLARLRGDGAALAGHDDLARLKLAAALGILDGRCEVSEDDWHLAAVVARHSARTRAEVEEHLRTQAYERGLQRAESEGRREDHRDSAKEANARERVQRLLMRHLPAPETGMGIAYNDLKKCFASRDRSLMDELLEAMVTSGQAEKRKAGSGFAYRRGAVQ